MINRNQMINKKVVFVMLLLLVAAANVFAADDAPWNNSLEKLLDWITGSTAKLVVIIITALIGIGLAAGVIGGEAGKQKIFYVVIGGAVVFSAQTIVSKLFNV